MGMIKIPTASIEYFNNNYNEIFESGGLAEGKWNVKSAEWIAQYTGAPHALAINSNGAGIFTILSILKRYRSKKKVFLQSNTMYGVKTMALASGLELCGFVDCALDYLMPTASQVKSFISGLERPNECVFLLTHIGGWVNPDIKEIALLCRDNGIALIEDCAHSLGSTLDGQHTGLFGDAGVYSLYATKTVPVGEGGLFVTNDYELHEMASKFVIYDRFEQKLDIGVNLRMSEINALLTYSVIKETDSIIANKYAIANKYINACDEFDWEYIDPSKTGQKSNLYKFILLSRDSDPVGKFNQIITKTSSVYDYVLGDDPENVAQRHVCLPIWYKLEEEVISTVLNELKISF